MRLGGIWDHVGFGFHRYSTDADWLLPHFEKMLYDQALLMMAYTEAWQLTKNPLFEQTVKEIAEYVQRDLLHPDGGFYSAEDADSDGEEGKFYVWKADELRELLLKDFDFIEEHFSINDEGNFEDEATRQKTGQNILHLSEVLNEDVVKWDNIRLKLYDARANRIRPLLDDKILTDWNALMIAAFAKSGAVFQHQEFINIAQKAYSFIEEHLTTKTELFHRFKDEEAAIPAFSDDYLNLAWAGLELYQATFNEQYLVDTKDFLDNAINKFWDLENGGFYLTNDHSDQPLGLQKLIYDGAIPSSNSVGLMCLVKISRITGDQSYEEKAHLLGEFFSSDLIRSGSSITMSMMALQFLNQNSGEIVVATGNNDKSELKEFLLAEFIPNKIILWKNSPDELIEIAKFTAQQNQKNGATQIYVCENYACDQPVSNLEELRAKL